MAGPILLLSDLHLPTTPSPLRQAFLRFLDGPARSARSVYILGDLFEFWIGDREGLRDYAAETEALRRLSGRGVAVYFMHGNRDFMVGTRYARSAGIGLLPDPLRLELAGMPTLLSHGDRYCTDDLGYQRWRRFSRNPLAQAGYRRLPKSLRLRIAGAARGGSGAERRNKPEAITDVNTAAVTEAIRSAGVGRLIHGHTHRPAEHLVPLADGDAERIVLADWRPGHCEYLLADDQGLHRKLLPAS